MFSCMLYILYIKNIIITSGMLIGTFVAATAFLDIFYLTKYLKRYRQIKAQILRLTSNKILNVYEFHEIIKNLKQPSGYFLVKGIMKASKSQQDKNIFSAILKHSYNNNDPIMEHAYDKIPFKKVLQLAFWRRPQQLKDINFDLHDMNIPNCPPISVQGCQDSSISGALSNILQFQVNIQSDDNKLLKLIRNIYDKIINIYPFSLIKKQRATGQKVQYYAMLDNMYSIVAGTVTKQTSINKTKITMKNPQYITKQISFILKNIKKKLLYYKTVLFLLICLHLFLLYLLIKWMYTQYINKINDLEFQQQALQQIKPGEQCIICYMAPRSVIFKPCKHYGLCQRCYTRLAEKNCPICKSYIEGIIEVLKIN